MKKFVWAEFIAFFIGVPVALFFHPTRWDGHICLWLFSLYALFVMRRTPGFSWRDLWHGTQWPRPRKLFALERFAAATLAILAFTYAIVPERLLSFPLQRPRFWLIVMILYPVLSALPQELVFRSFFFRRYAAIFPGKFMLIATSALTFGLVHIMFHNWVSPLFCVIGGVFIAQSYTEHRALKWAALEHSLYGCMVFTAGIGFYFLVGAFRG